MTLKVAHNGSAELTTGPSEGSAEVGGASVGSRGFTGP